MRKRTLLSLVSVVPLFAACGFRLRGVPQFAFHSLFIQAPRGSMLARELERTLSSSTEKLTVLRDPRSPDDAEVIFELISERQERVVVGLNASGQVRELQLRLRLRFRLRKPMATMSFPTPNCCSSATSATTKPSPCPKRRKSCCCSATCRPIWCSSCCAGSRP